MPVVLWLDEGAALGLSPDQRRKNAVEMREILRSYGFSYHFARLEDYNRGEVSVCDGGEELQYDELQARALYTSLSSLKDASARQELLLQVRRSVLLAVAAQMSCLKIMTGETGSRLAV